jgi:hypothetical protein
MHGIRIVDLADEDFGLVPLGLVVPHDDDNWGVLAPLQGTLWGDLIAVVPGPALSDALHGFAKPLMQHIGPSPRELARKLAASSNPRCALGQNKSCAFATAKCVPGPKLPDCYEAPGLVGEQVELASSVALMWREGRYVLRVEGVEHSIT